MRSILLKAACAHWLLILPIAQVFAAQPPTINSGPTNLSLMEGQTATFTVFVSGDPYPTFQWFSNETPIPGKTNNVLRIAEVRLEDAGSYFVTASNSEGSVTSAPAALVVTRARTGAGSVDRTFRPGTGANGNITRIALQNDGRILAAGQFTQFSGTNRNGCARLHSDGSVDASFTPYGFTAGDVQFLAVVADGKILANKSLEMMVRWNSDGSIDPVFTLPPFQPGRLDVLGIQPDGRIAFASSSLQGYAFGRLTSDGRGDFTFNSTGWSPEGGGQQSPYYPIWGAALNNGKLVAMGAGGFFRMHRHGAPDTSFRGASSGGVRVVAPKSDGKIFVAGTFTNVAGVPRSTLALLQPDGTPDLAFNPDLPPAGTIQAMAVQPDGKPLIGGTFTNIGPLGMGRIARLNVDGTLDRTFDPGAGPGLNPLSGLSASVTAILLQPDCKILIAGDFTTFDGYPRARIVRLNTDPQTAPIITREPASQSVTAAANAVLAVEATCLPAAAFQWFGNEIAIPDATNSVLLLSNVSSASASDYYVVLSNTLGVVTSTVATISVNPAPSAPATVAPEFAVGDGADSTIRAMARQSNGKLIVAGWFREIHGIPCPGIARLNPDGSVDTSFDVGSGPNNRVLALAIDANDRILLGGMFTNFNGYARNRLVRLNPNGDVDTTFQIDNGFTGGTYPGAVNAVALQPDGKILVGGGYWYFNNTNRPKFTRLHPAGSMDTSFANGEVFEDVLSVAVQHDGRIWLGLRNRLMRLETNGTRSANLPVPQFTGEVRSLLVLPDGNILFGGFFDLGIPLPYGIRSAVARLNANGTLDTNFNQTLFAHADGTGVETMQLHSCGQILMGGSFSLDATNHRPYHIARLDSAGSLDPVFGAKALDGTVYDIDASPSTEVVIAGQFSAVDHTVRNGLARLRIEPIGPPTIFAHPAGQSTDSGREVLLSVVVTNCTDFTFQWQLNGTNISGATNATLLLPNVRVSDVGDYRVLIRNGAYVSISEPAELSVVPERRHPGSTDVDFFPPRAWDGPVQALALDGNGNLLAGGSFTRINGLGANRLARFNRRGEFDSAFQTSSNLVGTIYSLAVQPDGKVLAAGVLAMPPYFNSTNLVLRLLADGRADPTFRGLFSGGGTAMAVAALPDGKILIGGILTAASLDASRSGIARLHSNGTLDTNFASGGVRHPLCLARHEDGRILIGGTFTGVGGAPRAGLARLHPDGLLDATFGPGEGANSPVMAVALARDEKPYIGGNFTRVAGIPRTGIARLNHDGSVDASFDPGLGVRSVWALAVQPDDKLLVGGSFLFAGGLPRSGIARFNADGTIDPTFDPGSGANGQVFAVLCDPTGKIYLGGNFTAYNGFVRDHLARANGDLFLMNLKLVGGSFQVSLFTFYGESYTLEFKSALTDSEWMQPSALLGDGTIRTFTDPAPEGPSRWYRIRVER